MRAYVNGEPVEFQPTHAEIESLPDRLVVRVDGVARTAACVRVGDVAYVSYRGHQWRVETNPARAASAGVSSGELRAPMPGSIVEVYVEVGAIVKKGEKLLVLEAMKTQQAFFSPFDGTVALISVVKGQQVDDGRVLAVVEPEGGKEPI